MRQELSLKILLVLGIGASVIPATIGNPLRPRAGNASLTDWEKILPSEDIQWTPCFGEHFCCRLQVPLDYSNPNVGNTTLAIIKKPAVNETKDTPNIQLNAGGPGGSTVELVLGKGQTISSAIGAQYNLIGIDPRGVNNSGPSLSCFPDDPATEIVWKASLSDRIADSKMPNSLSRYYDATTAYGKWCTQIHKDGPGRYVTTHAVATDILHFTEKQAIANGQPPKEAKIWYLSGSYGAGLGQTIATLFPDRVERMVIDSVVDIDAYLHGNLAPTLSDSTGVLQDFFNRCYAAGPDYCAIYCSSPQEIEQRTRTIIDSVRSDPIAVSDSKIVPYPKLVSYKEVQAFIIVSMYSQHNFPRLALGLKELEDRNGTSIVNIFETFESTIGLTEMVHISCLDAANRGNMSSIERVTEQFRATNEVAPWVGDGWASLSSAMCAGRDILPVPHQQINETGANTSIPILFLTNTLDPATGHQDAFKTSELYPGSVVLQTNCTGHGFVGFKSKCRDEHIQAYLATAKLPPHNITCEVDEGNPFLDPLWNPSAFTKS